MREHALKARGLAQHAAMAKRQARPSDSASGVLDPIVGGNAASASTNTAATTAPVASDTRSEASIPVTQTTTTTPVPVEVSTTASVVPSTSITTTASAVVPSSSSSILTSTSTILPSSSITPSSTESVIQSRSTITVGQSTNVIIRSITQTPSSTASIADASTSSAPSNGPGTGAVVGIVAAALVGVVVIASLLGYFFKAKCSGKDDDDIDDAVFDKNEFRRDSTMLPDDDQMSMRSGSVAGYHSNLSHSASMAGLGGLARGNTSNPRPPSILERHYLNAGSSPAPGANFSQQQSYQGAQVGQYFSQQPQYDQYGYPTSHQQGGAQNYNAQPVNNLGRADSQASYYQDRSNSANGYYAAHEAPASSIGRSNSSATTAGAIVYPPGAAQSERPLSEISEGGEDAFARAHQRTGTPEEHNPQYYFRSHSNNPSNGSAVRSGSANQLYANGGEQQRRLSIRNNQEDAYGGSY